MPLEPSTPGWLRSLVAGLSEVRAEELSRFLPPDDGSGRPCAVLIALTHTEQGPAVLLTQRSADLRQHAGQVAFPGGAADECDASLAATALREAEEEVGLRPDEVHVLAELPAIYLPVSSFVVTPVVAWFDTDRTLAPADPREVAATVLVRVDELVDPANRFRVVHPSGWRGPAFEAGGLFIWGFTAGLLDRVLHMSGWALPWDDSVFRSLAPEALGGVPGWSPGPESPGPGRRTEQPDPGGRAGPGSTAPD